STQHCPSIVCLGPSPSPTMASSSSQFAFSLHDGSLTVGGTVLLSGVPSNVALSPFQFDPSSSDAPAHLLEQATAAAGRGAFLGFTAPAATDRAPCRIGLLAGRRFLSVFRFKTWWSTMRAGDRGRDVQPETQWVLLDAPELGPGGCVFVLPLVQGSFRSAIFPSEDVEDGLVLCAESGSPAVTGSDFRRIAYVHAGTDPYKVMREAYVAARVHLGTFKLIEEKALPPMAERFGWCTWDAFYLTVDPAGVWQGVAEFTDAGVPPRFVVIDDGWQSANRDDDPPHADTPGLVLCGEQMTARLYGFDEGERFRRYREGDLLRCPPELFYDKNLPKTVVRKACEIEGIVNARKKAAATEMSSLDAKLEQLRRELEQLLAKSADVLEKLRNRDGGDGGEVGLKAFLKDMRQKFPSLDDVYVWQALCGAWGGVRPGTAALDTVVEAARLSPGLAGTMDDLAVDRIVEGGIGLVQPQHAGKLYDAMHSYLAGAGVTGVKVDVINTLEYVCAEHGGRVELAKAYYGGLSDSIAANFEGTGIIASMEQCNDFFFLGTRQVAMARAGDDFWLGNGDDAYWLQGVHMVNCSYNSLWMGQFVRPDWDMFQSDHVCAAFHAASRAVSGSPIYVSDSLGCHDFALLKTLVFPDGTLPLCLHYALPSSRTLSRIRRLSSRCGTSTSLEV
uniref:galactinol--sucrose galactosyltransferase n=1 Tax=Aegilops tauschii subsp. strangulata TaxID=200361 RepID=A0A453A3I0_AEGTS